MSLSNNMWYVRSNCDRLKHEAWQRFGNGKSDKQSL